ncbi:MAG: hypothetical protein Q7S84_00850 [bacterium]|nr:hypothetical protein [bacterium]
MPYKGTVEWFAYSGTVQGNQGLIEWLRDHGETVADGIEIKGLESKDGSPVVGFPFSEKLINELKSLAKSDTRLKIRILSRRSRAEKLNKSTWLMKRRRSPSNMSGRKNAPR